MLLGNVYVQKWCFVWYCVITIPWKKTPSCSCTIRENQQRSQAIQFDNIPIVDGEIDFYIENVGCVLI